MQFSIYKLPYAINGSTLKIITVSLLMIWYETGTILSPEIVYRDIGKKVEKPAQSPERHPKKCLKDKIHLHYCGNRIFDR